MFSDPHHNVKRARVSGRIACEASTAFVQHPAEIPVCRWLGMESDHLAHDEKFVDDDNHNKFNHLIIKTVVGLIEIIEKLWKITF